MRTAATGVLVRLVVLATLGSSGVLAACGGGGPSTEKTWVDRPVVDKKAARAGAGEGEEARRTNERWEKIQEYFWRYTSRPISRQKDIFLSQLHEFVERSEVKKSDDTPADAVSEPEVPTPEEELNPLKKYPADEYRAQIILTGTAKPSALIRDPKGNTHTIYVDTELGNEHGVVVAITQYEVVVRQPNEPRPTRLSARPEVFEVGIRQARTRDREEAPSEVPLLDGEGSGDTP